MKTIGLLLFLSVFALQIPAQDTNGDSVVSYLVPINAPLPTPGAFGTEWVTEVWVHNGTGQPIKLAGCGPPGTFPPPGAPCAEDRHPAGMTRLAFAHETPEEFDSVVYHAFSPDLAPHVVISSRMFELTRRSQPVGVELPVVREDEFLTDPVRLIAIPRNATSRAALRIYDPRSRAGGVTFRVEAVDLSGRVLAQRLIAVADRDVFGVPNVALIPDVAALFPEVQSVDRYDLRVTPVGDDIEFWAFVSVTDNDTQQVFTITPPR